MAAKWKRRIERRFDGQVSQFLVEMMVDYGYLLKEVDADGTTTYRLTKSGEQVVDARKWDKTKPGVNR